MNHESLYKLKREYILGANCRYRINESCLSNSAVNREASSIPDSPNTHTGVPADRHTPDRWWLDAGHKGSDGYMPVAVSLLNYSFSDYIQENFLQKHTNGSRPGSCRNLTNLSSTRRGIKGLKVIVSYFLFPDSAGFAGAVPVARRRDLSLSFPTLAH